MVAKQSDYCSTAPADKQMVNAKMSGKWDYMPISFKAGIC